MTDESTALDEAAAKIVDKLRADLKPKRTWARNKAWFEARIASLERHAEGLAERHAAEFRRAEFNGRVALIGWCTAAGMLVLVAAKW